MSAGKRPMVPPAGMMNPTLVRQQMPIAPLGAPARVEPPSPSYPLGGQWTSLLPVPNYATGSTQTLLSAVTNLAKWSRDVSTRVLVTVNAYTGPFGPGSSAVKGTPPFCGVAARISWGDSRGGHSIWRAAPFQQIIDASYIRVDALLNWVPFFRAFQKGGIGGPFNMQNQTLSVAPWLVGSDILQGPGFQAQAKCTISEGSEAYTQSDLIHSGFGGECQIAAGPIFVGPAIVDSIVFHNPNAAPIIMTVADDNGILAAKGAYPGMMSVIVPANSSKEVSPGTIQVGLMPFGITTFGNSAAEDPNDVNVTCDVFGSILQDAY